MGSETSVTPLAAFVYTLDTNAIIYYLKDDSDAVLVLRDIFVQKSPLYVSAITEVELFGFSNLTAREIEQIENILRTIAVIPVDSRIARIAGLFRRQYHLKVSDGVIAATAMFTGTVLLTRNIRDFRRIPDLPLREI